MKLNHINLVVGDVAKCITFFETYFGFSCSEVKGDHIIATLEGTGGFTLVLMAARDGNDQYPKDFHIGFMLSSAAEVDATHKKLTDGGVHIENSPGK